MSRVQYDSNESCHTLMSWLIHMCGTTHESCHTCEYVVSHVWMSHVTHMDTHLYNAQINWMCVLKESCHTHERVTSCMNESCHTWMSHATHMNESCHTYGDTLLFYDTPVNSRRMSYVAHINESCHPQLSRSTHMHESCRTRECVMSHVWTHPFWIPRSKANTMQGGADALDALRCRSLSTQEPLIVGLFCGKMTYQNKASYVSSPPCRNESCYTHGWVLSRMHESSHTWIVLHINKTCHIWINRVIWHGCIIDLFCRIQSLLLCHALMRHVTY